MVGFGNTEIAMLQSITIRITDVTLEFKNQSSTKIIVEKGGKLTLDGCVTYGPVEVNGGTLTVRTTLLHN